MLALKSVLRGKETFKDEPLFQYVVLINYACLIGFDFYSFLKKWYLNLIKYTISLKKK